MIGLPSKPYIVLSLDTPIEPYITLSSQNLIQVTVVRRCKNCDKESFHK